MKALSSWVTTPNAARLERQKPVFFRKRGTKGLPIIAVQKDERYQTMAGFGFSLTGGSAYHISRLPAKERRALLRELFGKNGIGISTLRLTIGASDLDEKAYSYADVPGKKLGGLLANFNLFAGGKEVVPLLKEILKIAPDIRILASPWSAPPWMKTNNSFIGGHLRSECRPVYAQYLAEYVLRMREPGITVHGITVQNEPLNDANEPSMVMEAAEQIKFNAYNLGPTFWENGITPKIYCWDHNCDRPDYALRVLNNAEAREFVNGSAWHLYGGVIEVLDYVHEMYPNHEILFIEQWVGKNSNFGGDLWWHSKNITIGAPRNWATTVFEWNLANNPECNPHTPKGCDQCLGALTIGPNGEVTRNIAYYTIGHASKFVPAGSVRIGSSTEKGLSSVAYETPDGKTVMVVLNEGGEARTFAIQDGEHLAEVSLPGGSLATYVW